ncbi:16S rRNA (cytosine(967)-C(5))-methyltransferase RsmB [Hazenella coriacea]|uniref:16S rRNA (cytosine(967)-C(5))-methyltransferase n=1 Tax=Hazenella coriacea TaxID=1179467 RepID=A0A4R3L2F2_9BACL|nr:16S rRNA (cytosine(967)-C(5))-methyltransferase RsmB [Hazenella coriacea]TCS93075.1 16S rRNA (cytosine967-C5)-methyltransferase [Hazenella coriacea]
MARPTAREVALDILIQIEVQQAYSNLALNQHLQQSNLDPRDKRLVTELVYGCIQRQNTLDWMILQLVKKARSLEPWVKQVLRLGLYQLAYLDKIPERAAVHETVQLTKRRGYLGVSKLVNGVLRNYLRRKHELSPPSHPRSLTQKAIAYSHPAWMIKHLEMAYGEEVARQVCEANLIPPKVCVRVNTLQMDRETFITQWNQTEEGEAIPSELVPDGVIIRKGGNPAYSRLFEQGACTIQDESSMLVGQILSPKPGMKVLDACAAPGSKTTHLAQLMNNEGVILANDIHPHKMDLIQSQVRRLGIEIVKTHSCDARQLSQRLQGEQYDAILLDAPCSGLGVIHRKPDIKWGKEVQDVQALVQVQQDILETLTTLLKPGGTLVYSTCTWEPSENCEQITRFVKDHPDFILDKTITTDLPPELQDRVIKGPGWIQILPHHFQSDGFFISRLIKKRV